MRTNVATVKERKNKSYYNNEKDGQSYYMENGKLMSCPTNSDGTPDTYEGVQGYVDDYDEPLQDAEKIIIYKALILN